MLPGVNLSDLRWEWVPAGMPWIDPLKEINADIAAIGAGLSSRTRRLREQGIDFKELVDELAAEQKYLVEKGLSPSLKVTDPEIMGVANA